MSIHIETLRNQPGVQGLVQLAHNAIDRIKKLEKENARLKDQLANQMANQPETCGSPKPLTEEQVFAIFDSDCSSFGDGVLGFVRAIEAAHGIKGAV